MNKLRIQWIKSDIGFSADQKRTIKALGLHRLNETVEQKDSPSVRGMIRKVSHLIKVEVTDNAAA
jgi:large subunit ribosomal protein L30